MESSHLPWLDWLRFFAAFMVLLVHARGLALPEYGALPPEQQKPWFAAFYLLTRMRREAVLLFFVLSGFLVGGRLIDRVVSGEFRAGDYALDRLTRIYIPLVPALVLSGVVAWFTHAPSGFMLFIGNMLGLQQVVTGVFGANDPLWTLAFEIWFYTLGGALAWLVYARRLSWVSGLLLLAALAVFSRLGDSFLFCWLIGAVAWRTRPEKRSAALLALGLILAAAGSAATQLNIESSAMGSEAAGVRGWVPDQPLVRLVLAAGFALVVQQLIGWRPTEPLAGLDRWGTRLSAWSYTLYLTHYPVLALLGHFGWPRAARIDLVAFTSLLGALTVSIAVAWLMYFLFESHTADARRWLRVRWGG